MFSTLHFVRKDVLEFVVVVCYIWCTYTFLYTYNLIVLNVHTGLAIARKLMHAHTLRPRIYRHAIS